MSEFDTVYPLVKKQIASLFSGPASGRDQTSHDLALSHFEILPAHQIGGEGLRAVAGIRTRGCRWFRREGDACSHCGLINDPIWHPDLAEEVTLRDAEIAVARTLQHGASVLCLYVPGSFLDDAEVPPSTRLKILEFVDACPTIDQLLIETRPEFVNEAVVSSLRDALPNTQLVIGLPLESTNEDIRRISLNKVITQRRYDRAAKLILDGGAGLFTHVLLKPPFLSESEAIIDTTRSAEYALSLGATVVSIEPIYIQKGTLVYELWKSDQYRSPWIWSIYQVLENLYFDDRVKVGGAVVFPAEQTGPFNCRNCSDRLLEILYEPDSRRRSEVLQRERCACKEEWTQACCNPSEFTPKNVLAALSKLEKVE